MIRTIKGANELRGVKLFFLNAVMLAGVNILIRLVSVSFNAYVSGKVGAEGMGLLTLVMSVYGLSVTLATSGVHLAAVRLTAEALAKGENNRTVIRGCILYSLLFGSFTAVLLFSLAEPLGMHLLGDIRTIPSLRVLALSLPAISLSTALAGYFTGVRRVVKNVIVSLSEQFVKIFLTSALLLLIAPAGIEYACLAVVGGSAIAEGASFATSFVLYLTDKTRRCAPSENGALASIRRVFSVGFPVAVGSYARQGLLTAEHLAIPWGLRQSGATASAALASYGVLHGMVFPLVLFPSAVLGAFSGLLVPEFTHAHERGDTERIQSMATKVLRTSLLFSLGVAGIFLSFSYEIGSAMYPGTDAGAQLARIAPLIPIMYLDSSVDAMLKGLGQQVHSMKINIVDSALSLLLVFLLLPRFGMAGYIAVLYVCELLNATLSISRLLSITGLPVSIRRFIAKPIASIILATAAVRFLAGYGIVPLIGAGESVALRIAFVAVIYAVLTVLTGAVGRDDARFVKRIFA